MCDDIDMDEFGVEDLLTEAAQGGSDDDFYEAVEAVMIWADEDADEFWRVVGNSGASSAEVMRAIQGELEPVE